MLYVWLCVCSLCALNPQHLSVDDRRLPRVAQFAVEELGKVSARLSQPKLVRIVRATVQVVAGLEYRLALELTDASDALQHGGHLVRVTVWDRFGSMQLVENRLCAQLHHCLDS